MGLPSKQKMAADIIAASQKSGKPIHPSFHQDVEDVCQTFLALAQEEGISKAKIDRSAQTLKSIIADWQWDGATTASLSFWQVAFNIVKPLGKELLTMAVKAAVDAAVDKLA